MIIFDQPYRAARRPAHQDAGRKDSLPVNELDAPVLLVVGGNVPRGVASLCARERGFRPVFARDLIEAVRVLHRVLPAAAVVIPPSSPYDACRVAATLRAQAPELPVALVLGPGRLDERPRVMWPLTVPMMPVARDAIADIAAQACIDWVERTWEEAAPTLDVTDPDVSFPAAVVRNDAPSTAR
jgi:hypothetical protein